MVLIKHELRQGKRMLFCWAGLVAMMLGICILIYPEMASEMDSVSSLFANMGGFSAAFGLDQISFGEFIGFFSVECGNILGLGGAFFSALLGITALAKEEKDHTAEFLLTHPIRRKQIVLQKYLAVLIQILVFNFVIIVFSGACIFLIHEKVNLQLLSLLFLAYLFLQIEIATICFGLSARVIHFGYGLGLGLTAFLYFLNLFTNLSDKLKFLKVITPFGFAEGTEIIGKASLNSGYLAFGGVISILFLILGFNYYDKKDIS